MTKFYGKGEELATKDYVDNEIQDKITAMLNTVIASAYDSTISYGVGDYVIYDNRLYVCLEATSGDWDSTCWSRLTVMGNNN